MAGGTPVVARSEVKFQTIAGPCPPQPLPRASKPADVTSLSNMLLIHCPSMPFPHTRTRYIYICRSLIGDNCVLKIAIDKKLHILRLNDYVRALAFQVSYGPFLMLDSFDLNIIILKIK